MKTTNPRLQYGLKNRGADKVIRVQEALPGSEVLKKPAWLKVKFPATAAVVELKKALRKSKLHTVCEEAACPNIGECFSNGTATFMILGDICTRRCSFCDVATGRPLLPDPGEPQRLAESVQAMALKYVVITSVDRDDLFDGGSKHFVRCIRAVRDLNPGVRIETLVPDFRKKLEVALETLAQDPPDVFNHNIETVPRLYYTTRPGSDYRHSLELIRRFKQAHPAIPTKSGLMLGLGESNEEIVEVLQDLYDNGCDLLTIGQYLQPSKHHAAVQRYVPPAEFDQLKESAQQIGFRDVAAGPLVRSSYHADIQSRQALERLTSAR